jgi:hypothetical protein
MRKSGILTATISAFLLTGASPALAAKWTGKTTNTKGHFNHGKVTFSTSGSTMKNLIIEGVATSGCGGYKRVIVPKLKIKGSKFSAVYVPISDLNDVIRVAGTISGSKASGRFSEGPLDIGKPPLCQNSGKFTARKG